MSISKCVKVKEYITQQIHFGELKPGSEVPSLTDLSRQFSINRNTAVKALNELAAEGRIYQRRGLGSFVSPKKDRLRTENFAILVSNLSSPIYGNIIHGIEEHCRALSRHLISASHLASRAIQRETITRLVDENKVDGIVLFPVSTDKDEINFLEQIRASGMPMLVFYPQGALSGLSTMTFDHFEGLTISMEHLLGNGYRRIGFVTNRYHNFDEMERLYGYRSALEKAGLVFRDDYVFTVEDAEERYARPAADAIIAHPDRPEALVVISDEVAIGLINRFQELGLKVPDDMAITAGGNIELGMHPFYSLTTITPDFQEMGKAIAECLERQASVSNAPSERLVFRQSLVIRGSSGTCKLQPKGNKGSVKNNLGI
jgi:DNA-binding LacI/PurR family transcriptional regulator